MKIESTENIFNSFNDAILVSDMSGKVVFANDVFFEMFKTKKTDLLEKNIYDWKNGQFKPLESIVANLLSQKVIVKDFDLQLPEPVGKGISVTVREEKNIFHRGRNFLFIIRETGDKQNKEEKRNLASVFSNISDAVCLTDTNHNLTFVNEAFLKLYGYTESEIIGKPASILGSPEMNQDTINAIRTTAATGGFIGEIWNRKKDGTEFLVQLSTGVIRNDEGEVTAFIGIAKDISEQKVAAEELKKNKERYQTLFEHSVEAIYLYDGKTMKVLEANKAFLNWLGYSDGEVRGLPIYNFIANTKDSIDKSARQIIENGQHVLGERQWRRKDGSIIDVFVTGNKIHQSGKDIVFIVARDITERKTAEAALLYRVRFESLISALSAELIKCETTEIDREIEKSLTEIGKFFAVDRSYVFLFDEARTEMSNTHEWSREGVEPQKANLQNIPLDPFPWLINKIFNREVIYIPRLADMPAEASAEKEMLEPQGIKSLVIVPMVYKESVVGFLGFDSVQTERTWQEVDIQMLHLFAGIIVNTLERARSENILRITEHKQRLVLNNIDEIIYSIQTTADNPLEGKVQYVSAKIEQILGCTSSEFIKNPKFWLEMIHPDDLDMLAENTKEIFRTQKAGVRVYRFRHKHSGNYRWMEDTITPQLNEEGELVGFFGVSRDITDRKIAEEKLNSLSEHRKKLVEISESLFSTLSLDELLERIFKSLGEVIEYELSELYWMNEEKQLLISKSIPGSMNVKSGFKNWSMPLGKGLTSLAAEKKEAFVFNKAHLDVRSIYPDGLHVESDHLICVPILSAEKVIGVFDISRSTQPFTTEEFELVKLFIGYASLAINNIRSFEKIKLSEESYRNIIIWAPVGIYQSTPAGRLLSVNARFVEILGYSTIEELLNKNLNDIYYEQSERPKLISEYEPIGFVSNVEVLWKKKDGTPIWIELAAHATKDVTGNTIYFEGFITDISERKKAQTDLQKSKNRYQDLVENINDIYYIVDKNGKLIYGSPNLFIRSGYSAKEIIGKNYLKLIAKEDRRKVVDFYLARTNDGTVDTKMEFRSLLKNGETVWIEQTARVIRDAFGNVVEYRNIIREIDERKVAEAALCESEGRYKKLFVDDITADFIATPEGKLLACNPALVRMFAFGSEEEALATNISELFTTKENATEVLSLVRKHKRLEYHELEMRRRDGDAVFVIANIIGEFDESDKLTQITGYLFDDTNRKQLEHQLRQSQKLQSIGTLAGGIAHDFNNVLGAIMGYAELAIGKISINDPLSKYLQNIHLLTERGARITRQLLAFSRRQIIDPKNINLNILISDLLALIGKTIGEDIEIIFKPMKNIKTVYADSAQMEQVILNLCVNARDAMPSGGKLIIETKNLVIDETYIQHNPCSKAGEYVLLTVTDTGAGIPEEIRERIFEPFFTTKEQGKGTGLGLSMIHGIVGQHNGFIDLDSEIRNGTTFKIYLPAIEVKPDSAKTEFVRSNPTGDETILVVEDDSDMREMICSLLGMMGYKIISASDGEEGIAKFNENLTNINLVVSDVIMPRKGGKELYDYVKKKLPNIGFLFISGYTADELHKNFILDEKINILSKPFSPNDIINKVREILDNV